MASEHDGTPIRVAASFEEVRHLAACFRAFCTSAALPNDVAVDVELALVEAGNNIVQHGYAARPGGYIEMSVTADEAAVDLTLCDDGAPMPKGALAEAPVDVPFDAESGRGLAIMRGCVDRLDYQSYDGINCLRMVRNLARI